VRRANKYEVIMKIALIKLPEHNIPVDGVFTNITTYWQPPEIVLEHWGSGCKVEYISDEDYENKVDVVMASYIECINKHYREFVY